MGWNSSSSAWRNCTGLNHLSVCKTDWTMLLLMLAAMWWTFDWLFNDRFLPLENYIILMMIYLHLVMSIFNSIQLWLCSGHVDHQHIVSGTSLRKRVFPSCNFVFQIFQHGLTFTLNIGTDFGLSFTFPSKSRSLFFSQLPTFCWSCRVCSSSALSADWHTTSQKVVKKL